MKKTLIHTRATKIGDFNMPAFSLKQGEATTLKLPSDGTFYEYSMQLKELLEGNVKHPDIELLEQFRFVNHNFSNSWKERLFPTSIKDYFKKYALYKPTITNRMYEMFEVLPKTKVNALQGTPRKVLFLLATWTHHKYLMLDFMGADYVGMAKIKLLCNDILLENGAVIYLEHDDRNVKRPKFEINL